MHYEPDNQERADWAKRALITFAADTGLDMEEEPETAISDLLADLMHLARQMGLDWDQAMETATMNYDAEVEEEGD